MTKIKELLFFKHLKGFTNTKLNKEVVPELQNITGLDACVLFLNKHGYSFLESDILLSWEKAEKAYKKLLATKDITVITIYDSRYPKRLFDLANQKPVILYAKGNVSLLEKETVAVIGTREPSEWGIKVEKNLLSTIFYLSDPVIVSGLALGCDTIAHEMTLKENASTIAVLPSGVNAITPKSNEGLAFDIIAKGGCLLSEYEPDMPAQKHTYIQRDGIIAALSDKVIVIECKEKSGTMHTVNAAKKLGRRIGCYVPNNTNQSLGDFSGNRALMYYKGIIKLQNKEHLKTLLEDPYKRKKASKNRQLHLEL